MEVDAADAQTFDAMGLWGDVVLHETSHSPGFGAMWDAMGLPATDAAGGLRFTGALAAAWRRGEFAGIAAEAEFAWTGAPVETEGGPGAAGGHRDEKTFGNELMTGDIDGDDRMSMMSVAAPEGMG